MNPRIRQLEQDLARHTEPGIERVDTLQFLAWELWTTDRDRSIVLFQEGRKLATDLKYERGLMFSELNQGVMLYLESVERAMPHFDTALNWFEEHSDSEGLAHTANILGIIHWGFGDYQQGFSYTSRALDAYRESENPHGEGWANNVLGGFHFDLKDYENALPYYEAALKIFDDLIDPVGKGRALNGIGNVHRGLGNYDEALVQQEKSLKLERDAGHKFSESRTLNDIGLIHKQQGDFEQAEKYHLEALALRVELNYETGQTTSLLDLGELAFMRNELDSAREYVQRALKMSIDIKARPKVYRAYELLSTIEEAAGNYKAALEHHRNYRELEEQVSKETSERRLSSLRKSFEIESTRKEAEIYRLKHVELKEKNELLQSTLRQVSSAQAQIIQNSKMAALGKLVAGIVHEMNSPLGIITSGIDVSGRVAARLNSEMAGKNNSTNGEQNDTLTDLEDNIDASDSAAQQIRMIVDNLKQFVRLDEAPFQKVNIHQGLETTLFLMQNRYASRVKIEKEFDQLPDIYCYPTDLNQVFLNLLENACEVTPNGGTVSIKTFVEDNSVRVNISDTGAGISASTADEIFEAGYDHREGSRKFKTGLFTCKKIIEQNHHGSLTYVSDANIGTTFSISLPLHLESQVNAAQTDEDVV